MLNVIIYKKMNLEDRKEAQLKLLIHILYISTIEISVRGEGKIILTQYICTYMTTY